MIGSWMSILQSKGFNRWPESLFAHREQTMSIFITLGGSVIESVAKAWGCALDTLVREVTDRERRREKRTIGYLEGQEIKLDSFILTKPGSATATEA